MKSKGRVTPWMSLSYNKGRAWWGVDEPTRLVRHDFISFYFPGLAKIVQQDCPPPRIKLSVRAFFAHNCDRKLQQWKSASPNRDIIEIINENANPSPSWMSRCFGLSSRSGFHLSRSELIFLCSVPEGWKLGIECKVFNPRNPMHLISSWLQPLLLCSAVAPWDGFCNSITQMWETIQPVRSNSEDFIRMGQLNGQQKNAMRHYWRTIGAQSDYADAMTLAMHAASPMAQGSDYGSIPRDLAAGSMITNAQDVERFAAAARTVGYPSITVVHTPPTGSSEAVVSAMRASQTSASQTPWVFGIDVGSPNANGNAYFRTMDEAQREIAQSLAIPRELMEGTEHQASIPYSTALRRLPLAGEDLLPYLIRIGWDEELSTRVNTMYHGAEPVSPEMIVSAIEKDYPLRPETRRRLSQDLIGWLITRQGRNPATGNPPQPSWSPSEPAKIPAEVTEEDIDELIKKTSPSEIEDE